MAIIHSEDDPAGKEMPIVLFTDRARDVVIKALEQAGEDFYVPIPNEPDFVATLKRVVDDNPGKRGEELLRAILQELDRERECDPNKAARRQ